MSKITFILIVAVMAVATSCSYTQLATEDTRAPEGYEPAAPNVPRVYTEGPYAELGAYGEWVHAAPYGWAWVPYVQEEWYPYLYGHWAWNQLYGWTWISYEPYGWAVYHYGNWVFDPIYDWLWVPGYKWEPHRVEWAVYDDYICWAPEPLPGTRYDDPWTDPADNLWIVCDPLYFGSHDLPRYAQPQHDTEVPMFDTEVIRTSPTVSYLSSKSEKEVATTDIALRTVDTVEGNDIQRIELSPEEERIVKAKTDRVKKKVLRPAKPPAKKEKNDRDAKDDDESKTDKKARSED